MTTAALAGSHLSRAAVPRAARVPAPSLLILDVLVTGDAGQALRAALHSLGHARTHWHREPECAGEHATEAESRLPGLVADCRPDLCFLVFCADSLPRARALFQKVKSSLVGIPTMAVSDSGSPEDLIDLLQLGVADFVLCPLKAAELHPRICRLLQGLRHEESPTRALSERLDIKELVGESPAFLEQVKKIAVVAKTDASVLILGETGTGKEVCARAIHYLSRRSDLPFIPVTCGAIPRELVENELFGHAPGAFTGAMGARPGLIREAEGGTLLLDEVDSLPLQAQVNLLRFLQEKEYRPLGSSKSVPADVRVIAASNSDLKERVQAGALRQDLYYRLNVIPLTLPALRERPEDILPLANHFAAKYAEAFEKPCPTLSLEAQQLLLCYDWPGNVRELEHVIERAVVFAAQQVIYGSDLTLPRADWRGQQESFREMKARAVAEFERTCIQRLLLAHDGNISRAARAVRKNRRAFFELIRKYHIDARKPRVHHP